VLSAVILFIINQINIQYMSNMTIKSEFDVGTSIENASKEAMRVSQMLNVCVEFNFNGVTCIAMPNGTPHMLSENYMKVLKSETQHKNAFSL